ncbi:hypothetical protein Pcar_3417 [Syntrophotalea carbinolica DSM 2380]|uniref:Uncharacterized protein n=1 Tax=Syntrophotalea carbinolica (strain DSM 2380 / NBRC 103641 / GraBd1) TaxID=338963 RepID=J9UJI9_SYNC1|nr:hypothetical protein Pcar_3417 [Syntrophotalea carbinolica DSM 2380]
MISGYFSLKHFTKIGFFKNFLANAKWWSRIRIDHIILWQKKAEPKV